VVRMLELNPESLYPVDSGLALVHFDMEVQR